MVNHDRNDLFIKELWGLWAGLLAVAVLPFLSIYRVGPLSGFFLESGALVAALGLVLCTVFSGSLKTKPPRASVYFVALAIFWAVQARVMDLPYVGLSDMPAWAFVVLALGAWAMRAWAQKWGEARVVSVFAMVLVIGGALQALVGWLQYFGVAAKFAGFLMYREGIVEGQLAQRNHFGHYMMWSVLSLAWLWGRRRLHTAWAIVLLLMFAGVMALTGSRTIFAYVLALSGLIPVVAWRLGWLKSRLCVGFIVAILAVLACQLVADAVSSWFALDVNSATSRMGSDFGGSGRGYEWRKAWQIFLNAPWFGHGWGSYPLQGFLTNIYPTGFRPYENNVLFTHSHNSLLNLLAEMGVLGTILVMGGLVWAVWGCVKRGHDGVGLWALGLLTVSLVHSFFEYPLWYFYFLSVFGLILACAPSTESSGCLKNIRFTNIVVAIVSVFLLLGIGRLALVYQELRQLSDNVPRDVGKRAQNITGLLIVAKTEPMLRYYAELQLMRYVSLDDKIWDSWVHDHAESLRYRPYANAHKWGLIAARNGDVEAARVWLDKIYHYYPSKFSAYGKDVMRPENDAVLREHYTKTCWAYYAVLETIPDCVKMPKNAKSAN